MSTATITEYQVISKGSAQKMTEAVMAEIANGWQPCGALSSSSSTSDSGKPQTILVQAMVKYAA